ncbi:hypothetical protein [Paenibacillus periandrae]|uniref:hypothetical protein n=1 Tax=Paenibacillus periandrae TaxID=1761741 RepID=UPI001F0927EA|nr:hypothetical protein [Paenibacillus periandrae]
MADQDVINSFFRETVCGNCPGTLWGEKSICRVHEKSIGLIESCEQWKGKKVGESKQQLELFDISPAIEIIQRVEQELKDYSWMRREIRRLQIKIDQALQSTPDTSNRLVSTYGIEAAMPKAQGKRLTELTVDEKQYDRMVKRLNKLKTQIENIDIASESITDEREVTVLECILDGVRMNETAFHVGISRTWLNEIKHEVIRKMAWIMYEKELKNVVYVSNKMHTLDASDGI